VSYNKFIVVVLLAVALVASSCGGGSHLLSIQVLPQDPTILNNNTVYTFSRRHGTVCNSGLVQQPYISDCPEFFR